MAWPAGALRLLTHQISVDSERGVVVKRYVQYARGEPAREWRALRLLAEHAPGLAPEPLQADLYAEQPVVEMSLLPGAPLGGAPLMPEQQSALVRALGQLWQSVPVERVIAVAGEYGNEAQLAHLVSDLIAEGPDMGADPLVQAAYGAGADWLTWAVTVTGDPAGRQPVLGQGDGNLANFLWDGDRIRIVDFEDSGLSDRAFELAVLVEHISAWLGAGLRGDQFTAAFDLAPAERARLADCRRLVALHWLLLLRPGSAASDRNPQGTLRLQAERLLALF
jgi:aminoglycoside phosphotransferase (APT) family kinase protein